VSSCFIFCFVLYMYLSILVRRPPLAQHAHLPPTHFIITCFPATQKHKQSSRTPQMSSYLPSLLTSHLPPTTTDAKHALLLRLATRILTSRIGETQYATSRNRKSENDIRDAINKRRKRYYLLVKGGKEGKLIKLGNSIAVR